jgi:RimJ/RimL family protein N-acetyltransferase
VSLSLRRAASSDGARLLRWRNDPLTVKQSLTPRPVTRADHERWLNARLADPRTALFIITEGGRPAGQLRLDLGARREAEVSITVAPALRGRGVAVRALRAAAAPARRLGAAKLLARIKPDNVASAVAFLKAGFRFVRTGGPGARPLYFLERSL